jgi:hypothetical protein
MEDAVFDESPLTREQAVEFVENPVMISRASLEETRFLWRLLGPSFDTIIDMVLARRNSEPRTAINEKDRELSSQSYANLRSVAMIGGWSRKEVLRLIDEYLNPTLSSQFVYHGSTVSDNDWRRLRSNIRRSDE